MHVHCSMIIFAQGRLAPEPYNLSFPNYLKVDLVSWLYTNQKTSYIMNFGKHCLLFTVSIHVYFRNKETQQILSVTKNMRCNGSLWCY